MSFARFLEGRKTKCPECQYHFTNKDLDKIETQLWSGVFYCPKCQKILTRPSNQISVLLDKKSFQHTSHNIKYVQSQNEISFSISWQTSLSMTYLKFYFPLFLSSIMFTLLPVFPLFGVGGLLYFAFPAIYSVVKFFNKRTITVNKYTLSFFDSPLWSNKITQVNVLDIKNFSLHEVAEDSKLFDTKLTAFINIHLNNGHIIRLCSAPTWSDALSIKQTIIKYLNISDKENLDTSILTLGMISD